MRKHPWFGHVWVYLLETEAGSPDRNDPPTMKQFARSDKATKRGRQFGGLGPPRRRGLGAARGYVL